MIGLVLFGWLFDDCLWTFHVGFVRCVCHGVTVVFYLACFAFACLLFVSFGFDFLWFGL